MTGGAKARPHVVVLGGGFGGLAAVHAMRNADVDITLVDQHPYNTFQPLLYQVATATLNPGDVTWFLRSVRSHQDNVSVLQGEVRQIDTTGHSVSVAGTEDRELSYDKLVIATGATVNYFGIPGAERFAVPLYTRDDALRLRDDIVSHLERAAAAHQSDDLRVVIVGAGATGVETAGALAETRSKDLPVLFPELDPHRVHVTVVEMLDSPLAAFSAASQVYARQELQRRGVDLRFDTKVVEVRQDGVVVGDDEQFLPAGIVIWASGITVPDYVSKWNLPQGRGGRLEVDDRLRVRDVEDVYAVGDVAVGEGELALPQLALPAIQGGRYVGRAIAADVAGSGTGPFVYRDRGMLATIGRHSAVAEVAHLPQLRGTAAWLLWNAVHIVTLLGNRNRAATIVNLAAKYLAWNRTHSAIVGDTHGSGPPADAAGAEAGGDSHPQG